MSKMVATACLVIISIVLAAQMDLFNVELRNYIRQTVCDTLKQSEACNPTTP